MDWRRIADLDVEERYWMRRFLQAQEADNAARNLLRSVQRGGARPSPRVDLMAKDAAADVQRILRRLVAVKEMKAARDAEASAA